MEIKSDRLVVSTATRDADGKQIDPEERPAERVMDMAGVNVALSTGQTVGELQQGTRVTAVGQTIEFASGFRHSCQFCRHFDRARWKRLFPRLQLSEDMRERAALNEIRRMYLLHSPQSIHDMHPGTDGDIDVDHALAAMGVCNALTEMYNDVHVVHPMCGCPETDAADNPMPDLFQPRDSESARAGAAAYDSALHAAQGARTYRGVRVPVKQWFPKVKKEGKP